MQKLKPAPPGIVGSLVSNDAEGTLFEYPWLYFRRRRDFGEPKGWVLRPLGGWNYGYDEDYMCYASWTIWALTTWGAVSNDYLEGLGLLAGAMYLNEQRLARDLLVSRKIGPGASWVHNVMAGYCWYHYYILQKKSIPLRAGSWAELTGNLGAVVEEFGVGTRYSHEAHYKGACEGMTVAWVLDMLRGKRQKGWGEWWKPAVAIGILVAADYSKNS
jgi:hypothetical protein